MQRRRGAYGGQCVLTRAFRWLIWSGVATMFGLLWASAAAAATTTTVAPGATQTAIAGALTVDGHPVAGVRITAGLGPRDVASSTSDAQGAWRITVPGPGVYRLTLDTATLPPGVRVVHSELPEFRVFGGFAQRAVFTLSSGSQSGSTGPSRFHRFINLFVSGIRFGLIVGLCAVGLSLIYGTTGLVNFAHGELVTFGALVAWFFNTMSSGPRLPLILAAILGMLAAGVLGAVLEVGLWRPMVRRRSGAVARMLASIGLALFLRYLFQVIFTGNPRSYRQYSAQSPTKIGPLDFPIRDYAIMGVCLVALILVGLALQRTRLGTAVRAVSDERDLASASGIDARRVVFMVWIGGAMLAGLGGVLLGVSQSVQWNMGFRLLLTMFAAVVLGGLGNAFGAMAGGLVVGIASQVGTYWLPSDFQFAIALVILILVLLVRPQGILGVRERIG
jgi:neutral amino acid transport system permease protein